jgi:N-acetylglucosaminyldiphosphoundecaprenol N-acetyl-beta-D-mannosaminyltransferase
MQKSSIESTNEQLERDFSRNIWCILGFSFDNITMYQVIESIVLAASEKNSYFISTPNLNFLCAAHTDFRQSVINYDLSVADDMPIILLERVAGSDLIHFL